MSVSGYINFLTKPDCVKILKALDIPFREDELAVELKRMVRDIDKDTILRTVLGIPGGVERVELLGDLRPEKASLLEKENDQLVSPSLFKRFSIDTSPPRSNSLVKELKNRFEREGITYSPPNSNSGSPLRNSLNIPPSNAEQDKVNEIENPDELGAVGFDNNFVSNDNNPDEYFNLNEDQQDKILNTDPLNHHDFVPDVTSAERVPEPSSSHNTLENNHQQSSTLSFSASAVVLRNLFSKISRRSSTAFEQVSSAFNLNHQPPVSSESSYSGL